MPASHRQVISVGEILIDLIASDGSTRLEDVGSFDARAGGAPANAAVALSRLGVRAAFCGVAGDDPFGAKLRSTLIAEQVDVSRLRLAAEADTTLAFAWKDNRGDGHFRILRMADVLLSPGDVENAAIDQAAALIAGSVALTKEPSRSAIYRAVEIARSSEVPVCFDANIRPTLWADRRDMVSACEPVLMQCDFVKLSLDDAGHLFGTASNGEEAVAPLEESRARFVVVTDGSRGSWFAVRDGKRLVVSDRIPAFSVNAIDPTGAGDAFTGATISRLVRNRWQSLDAADIAWASAAGALATTKRGAMASLPTAGDVEAFLQQHRA